MMDDQGRLHMPNGFVGKTFEETKLKSEKAALQEKVEANRHERRRLAALERKLGDLEKALS